MTLRPYQEKLIVDINAAWDSGSRNVCAVMPTGSGKCLGRGTPVLMFDGTIKPVESVVVGDALMGPDSTPRLVVSVTSGVESLYRVKPTKGDSFVVNESHILSFKRTGTEDIINRDVLTYLKSSATFKHEHKAWRTGIEFPRKKLPIDPYFVGLWLAEGSTNGGCMITSPEPEVYNYLKHLTETLGWNIRAAQGSGCKEIHITFNNKRLSGPVFTLRLIGVHGNKHVPQIYKTSSREDRLRLLAGYLDGDGSMSHGGFDAITKTRVLADDLAFVARSLGLACYVTECTKTIKSLGFLGTYYRMSFSGDCSIIPNIVPRRKASPRGQIKDVLKTGIQLEPMGPGEYFGFELSGPDRLFLLGDFTVTHNTKTMSTLVQRRGEPTCSIAHRQELVSQISVAMAREGVMHRIIAPSPVIGLCVALHMEEFGQKFYHPNSPVAVAGVQTLIRRKTDIEQWLNQIKLWNIDEAHHLLRTNSWGKAVDLFPRALGMGYTATPVRADRKGLSRATTGVFDTMVLGPTMRELIDADYLSEYRIFAPAASVKREEIKVSTSTGEFDSKDLREKTHASGIVGDVVSSYLRFAPDKLGLTFTVDVEEAERTAAAYRAAGVSAEIVTANTPDHIRVELLKKFRRRQIMQIVNVDILGEGFDVPGVEVVSGARATESFGLYMQQFGRVLRIMEGKTHGIYIDHVDNVRRHGLPDRGRIWSLDPADASRRKKQVTDDIPIRTCVSCFSPYEAIHKFCPYCGAYPEPTRRDAPEYVDGDLAEYSAELLARMRGEIIRLDTGGPSIPFGATPPIEKRLHNLWHDRQVSQQALRETMQQWAGIWKYGHDYSDSMIDRRFYHTFGIDKLTAMTLPRAEADRLAQMIRETMT